MVDENKMKILKTSWELHNQVETAYLNHQAKPMQPFMLSILLALVLVHCWLVLY